MLYKTIILELLQQRQQMYDQLRKTRTVRPTLDHYALELKTRHEAWMELIRKAMPNGEQSQIASEALEMALSELEERLPGASQPDSNEPFSLDAAMAFILNPTSRD